MPYIVRLQGLASKLRNEISKNSLSLLLKFLDFQRSHSYMVFFLTGALLKVQVSHT